MSTCSLSASLSLIEGLARGYDSILLINELSVCLKGKVGSAIPILPILLHVKQVFNCRSYQKTIKYLLSFAFKKIETYKGILENCKSVHLLKSQSSQRVC